MKGTVVIFLKAPVAGRVKTRLARGVGPGRAAAIFRTLTKQAIAQARAGDWACVLAIDPPAARAGFKALWPAGLRRLPQSRGDLGRRLRAAFCALRSGPVLIIGADAPAMRTRHLRRAFSALRAADAVFGPSDDGGFWLVGLARGEAARGLFSKVRWSTRHALKDAIGGLPARHRVALVDRLGDIDDAADLRAIGPRAFIRSIARL